MIQACIKVNHIIHGKVWNCRIQVFSKLVESEYHGFQLLSKSTDAPNLQGVWARRNVSRESIVSLFKETHNGQGKKEYQVHELFFFLLGTLFFFWELSSFLVNGGAERLAAPGSSAKPGPRSWSASKPGA